MNRPPARGRITTARPPRPTPEVCAESEGSNFSDEQGFNGPDFPRHYQYGHLQRSVAAVTGGSRNNEQGGPAQTPRAQIYHYACRANACLSITYALGMSLRHLRKGSVPNSIVDGWSLHY